MAIQKTEAILLSKRDMRETSSIAHFYTKDFGRIKALIKGARGAQAKFGLYLHEFAKYDIVFYEKRKSDTYMVTQCDLLAPYPEIAENLDKRLKAFYAVELVDKFTALSDKSLQLYNLLEWALSSMVRQRYADRIIIIFQTKILENAGLMPDLDECVKCAGKIAKSGYFSIRHAGLLCQDCRNADVQSIAVSRGAVSSINAIKRQKVEKLDNLMITSSVANELSNLLERFIAYHLGEHLKTTDFIRQALIQ